MTEDKLKFCQLVDDEVYNLYDLEDGGDLCYNLMEQGVIHSGLDVHGAAQIVAQHMLQA